MTDQRVVITRGELALARACIAAPEEFDVTEPELRACQGIVIFCENGAPLSEDDAALARKLFEVIQSGKEPIGEAFLTASR